MTTKAIMVQGTGSDVGKSVLTAALCRILAQDDYLVAPFKAQNMALNSYVPKQGGEIGRAQAVQAEAAEVEATVDMNPVLLKPTEDTIAQVIIHGQAQQNMTAQEYFSSQQIGLEAIKESLSRLKEDYDIVVLEGAGSPAEINLKDYDIVNMKAAELAEAPVILVADIDRGGVFATLVGTFELLSKIERNRIKGIIINKFRGEVDRLQSGINYLEQELEVPVLGVIPYFNDFKIPEEDAIPSYIQGAEDYELDLAIINLPHISNFTDFDVLAQEPATRIRYVNSEAELGNPDLIILPGSKNTIEDLDYLYQTGMAKRIINYYHDGIPVIGICGGYQMLGKIIYDPLGIETDQKIIKGLGLLDVTTTLEEKKVTSQVKAILKNKNNFCLTTNEQELSGYEIHLGKTKLGNKAESIFEIITRSGTEVSVKDGACSEDGLVWGTYLHGIFDNDNFRRTLINYLREQKGLDLLEKDKLIVSQKREEAYNKLADQVRNNLDMDMIYKIME